MFIHVTICIHVCMCACLYVCIYVCMRIYLYIGIFDLDILRDIGGITSTLIYVCMKIKIRFIHIKIYMDKSIYIQSIYIYIYIYIYILVFLTWISSGI
jgi:hypothetical protein